MKEINGQLYGYSYELDQTSEEDGTTCFAVDNGSVYVAYSGIWYEQPVKWAAGIGSSGGGGGGSGGGGGGGGGVLKVTLSGDDLTADKTAGEIYAAMSEGLVIFEYDTESDAAVELCLNASYVDGVGYYFYTWNITPDLFAETENDYPALPDDDNP